MKKVLFLATPYDIGSNMSGIGLRIWELAQVLCNYFEVSILSDKPIDIKHKGISCKIFDEDTWRTEIDKVDTLICYDLPDPRILLYAYNNRKQIITENAVPLEHLDYSNVKNADNPNDFYQSIVSVFKLQVLLSDYFITRAPIEQNTLVTSLALLNRINYTTYQKKTQLSSLLTYIPVGFNDFSEIHKHQVTTADSHYDFVWNGGIWDYYNASMIPNSIHQLKLQGQSVNFLFMYMPPDNQLIEEVAITQELTETLGVTKEITFYQKPISHFDRDAFFTNTRAFVCVGRNSIENHTCHRLRLRDVFLYEKPIIVDGYGATADLVRQFQIGIVINNQAELNQALNKLKNDESYYQLLISNIKNTKHLFKFENNIQELVQFIHSGQKAPDENTNIRLKTINQLLNESSDLQKEPTYPF
ncbi:hypothetical protein [Bacillus mycoides]|uniref:hypothetical protein n=1 Tax=Bacillus mycoides TaxID=1405 RepID=UPI003D1D438A